MDVALAFRTNPWLRPLAAGLSALLVAALLFMPRSVTSGPVEAPFSQTTRATLKALPASLQQAASGVLGGSQASYWLKPVADGFEGINPRQGLWLRSARLSRLQGRELS